MRREPRLASDRARRQGTRTGYIGSEVFLSLVDQAEAPYRGDLRQLTFDALCTNRDLPLLMPLGGRTDFTLTTSAPVESVRVLAGSVATDARRSPNGRSRGDSISHLGLNYLTLTELDGEEGAASLRRLLELYASAGRSADDAADRRRAGAGAASRHASNPANRAARVRPRCRTYADLRRERLRRRGGVSAGAGARAFLCASRVAQHIYRDGRTARSSAEKSRAGHPVPGSGPSHEVDAPVVTPEFAAFMQRLQRGALSL